MRSHLMAQGGSRPTRARAAWALGVLILMVAMLHLLGLDWLARHAPPIASALDAPARIEVAFVRELAPTAPPPAATSPSGAPGAPLAPARAVSRMSTVVVDTQAAEPSAPAAAAAPAAPPVPAPAPLPEPAPKPDAPARPEPDAPAAPVADKDRKPEIEPKPLVEPGADRATPPVVSPPALASPPPPPVQPVQPSISPNRPPEGVASAPAPPVPGAAPASTSPSTTPSATPPTAAVPTPPSPREATPFEWPPSTRLSYTLVGDYRGPVHGSATVEWLRSGPRYQVHLDVRVGPEMTPLMSRRMSSDGEITSQGLRPRRYDEVTRVLFSTKRRSVIFEADRVLLAGGGSAAWLPGVQDTASQFVQMTWWFNLQPQRLRAGDALEMPLALPNRVSLWHYEVVGEELLSLPFGSLQAWHLKPRRDSPGKSDLTAEVWIAPSLQYLPVRLRIRQEAEGVVELTLSRPPQQAAAAAPTPPASAARPAGAP